MALETGTFISDLVATNPVGSDPLAFADDHLRLVKSTIKNTFPNISGAVTKTHTQINTAVDQAGTAVQRAGDTMTGALTLPGNPSSNLQAAPKQYVDAGDAATLSSAASSAASLYPTKTGSGASGTWGINISGNAATASNGGVTSVNGATGAVTLGLLGVDQTWQDVTSSRALGTSYTNSTGKPIFVNVQNAWPSGYNVRVVIKATVGGVTFWIAADNSDEYGVAVGNFIVPPGATYSVTMENSSIGAWHELR